MRSFFRQPGHAQAITDALALRAISRIVAPGTGTEAANGKSGIRRQSRLNRGACLIQPAEPCQGGSKASMCVTKVSLVSIDRGAAKNLIRYRPHAMYVASKSPRSLGLVG